MRKKLQIFISSTYIDLIEERQAAVQAILKAGHIPAGMELFRAGDETQWDMIKRWIDESDVYMLILGGRYGTVEPTSGKSYTHLEYEYALARKMPVFAVVIKEQALTQKVNKVLSEGKNADAVKEINNVEKLGEFKELVKGRVCEFFEDTKDIQLAVHSKMNDYVMQDQLSGWVSGREIIEKENSMQNLEEYKNLVNENSELRATIKELQDQQQMQTDTIGLSNSKIISILKNNPISSTDLGNTDVFSVFIENKMKFIQGFDKFLNSHLERQIVPFLEIFGLMDMRDTYDRKLNDKGREFLIQYELDQANVSSTRETLR